MTKTKQKLRKHLIRLHLATRDLLDDLQDMGDDRNPETGKEYSTTRRLRKAANAVDKYFLKRSEQAK